MKTQTKFDQMRAVAKAQYEQMLAKIKEAETLEESLLGAPKLPFSEPTTARSAKAIPSIKHRILLCALQGATSQMIGDYIRQETPDFKQSNLGPKLSFYKDNEGLLALHGNIWTTTDKGKDILAKSTN